VLSRKPLFSGKAKIIFLSILAVVALGLACMVYKAWRIGSLALSLQARASRLQALQPEQVKIAALGPVIADIRSARVELHTLRDEAAPLLAFSPAFGWLPAYGADVEAAPAFLDMAVELADAGGVLLDSVEPHLAAAQEKFSIPFAVQMIRDVQPALGPARAHLDNAVQARARITRPLSPRVARWLALVDKALPLAVTAADAARIAPEALGLNGPRAYLVLAQNSDELRPTGGFMSSVGYVQIENGEIISQTFTDSYAVDDFSFPYPDPPPALLNYMGADIWVFRDANWSPDFPTSARDAIQLYQIGRPGPLDGVIAINLRAIPDLFEGLGPITVPGFDQPVTGQTVIDAMRQAALPEERSEDWWEHRKDFMGQLAGAVLARVQAGLKAEEGLRLARAVLATMDRRDVLVYLGSPEAQRILAQRKWDGALVQAPGDFLLVVDTNTGFNKVNPKIDEQVAYTVKLDADGSGQATLITTHNSRARPEPQCDPTPRYDKTYDSMMNRCYWDYLRVYAPAGSTLITATLQAPAPLVAKRFSDGLPTAGQEAGHAVFSSFFALRGGARQVTRFEYTLPQVVTAENGVRLYSLYAQRQSGSDDWPVEVAVILPANAQVIKTEPPAIESAHMLRWLFRLSSDQQVRVWYVLD
jgi:outer membrane protein assembly factor BamE (lipoprotein component of BamABCDE complex)